MGNKGALAAGGSLKRAAFGIQHFKNPYWLQVLKVTILDVLSPTMHKQQSTSFTVLTELSTLGK